MKKRSWWRFCLWSHVIGVIGFYLVLWLRTLPTKTDRIEKLPAQPKQQPLTTQVKATSFENSTPLVSIIVPARNEEQNIRHCLQSLLEQDYPNYEVVVVNDNSTDATATILDELASTHPHGQLLWVLQLRDLPEGWSGKPHALYQGVQEASGRWLLFTDADTWHSPQALRSAMAEALEKHIDMLSLATTQELPTFWNKVMMPMAYLGISMLYPPRQVNDPYSHVALANGQFILILRDVYEAIGSYARPGLRDTLLDDRDLARVVKEHGFKLYFADGRELVYVHMYDSFADIWRGWRKNAYLGNRGGISFVLLQLFGLPMISIVPFVIPLLTRLTRNRHTAGISVTEANIATVLELTPLLAYRSWLNRQLNVPWYYAFTHPLAGAIFTGILGQSMWRIVSGKGVDWRGRQYHSNKTTHEVKVPKLPIQNNIPLT